MAEFMIQSETLTGIADAIRERNKTTEEIAVTDMSKEILKNPSLAKVVTNDGNDFYSISADELRDTSANLLRRYAFYGCVGLTSIIVPENIYILNVSAFQGCTDLERIELLNTDYIAASVFKGCTALKFLILRGSSVPTIAADNLADCTKLWEDDGGIFVPQNKIEQYKADTGWSAYADCIKPLEELADIE